MNKKRFNLLNLLDGFVRAQSLLLGDEQLVAATAPATLPIEWVGPSNDIRLTLQRLLLEVSRSGGLLIEAVSQSRVGVEGLKFTVFWLDSRDRKLPVLPQNEFEVNDTLRGAGVSFWREASAVSTPRTNIKPSAVCVVSSDVRMVRLVTYQLEGIGHKVSHFTDALQASFQGIDVVLVDQDIGSANLRVAGGSRFIGLGERSDLHKKIQLPMLFGDIELLLQPSVVQRVLVVDDSPPSLYTTALILERLGYAATKASTAEDALALLAKQPFEILLTDINLPGMSGIELIAEAIRDNRELRVMALTGESTPAAYHAIFQAGAQQVILKPIRLNQLEQAISEPTIRIAGIHETGT